MGGRCVLPVVPCGPVIRKVQEENYLLGNFLGALEHARSWGPYRLEDERIIQVLEEQKQICEKALRTIKGEEV